MEVRGQHIVVVGLGKSGAAAARLLAERGARVTGNDMRTREHLGALAGELEAAGVSLQLEGHPASLLAAADRIVVSPGVPPMPALQAAEDAGVPIAGEVELASWFIEGQVVGITGTNGKSTVTSLVGEMCARGGRPCFAGGNLGTPLIDVVGTPAAAPGGTVVVELSSFQLERVDQLRVNVAALLNLSEDHLDRYPSYAAYCAAKGNIFRGQRPGDSAVLPAGDSATAALLSGPASVHHFGGGDGLEEAGEVRVEGADIVDVVSGLRFAVADLQLSGRHNVDNACAAALIARLAGASVADITAVLAGFGGLPHRMQAVGTRSGVRYFDDSKATNVGAACASLDGLSDESGRVVLIAGGCHKGASYQPLAKRLARRARGVVLIGEATGLLREALDGANYPVIERGSMQEAVQKAAALAEPGDIVLLSPACSSYDMFRSYAHRGQVFSEAVSALGEEAWD